MSKNNIYCGYKDVKEVSKTRGTKLKRGTAEECAAKGQIAYYGIKKIDPKRVNASKKSTSKMSAKDALKKELISLKGKKSKLLKQFQAEKNNKKKADIKKEGDMLIKKINELNIKFKKMSRQKSHK